MRPILALVLAVHGLAHLVGFLVPWGWAPGPAGTESAAAVAGNSLLGGRIVPGPAAARASSFLWLAATIAFVVLAVGVWRDAPWWRAALLPTVAVSLALCVLWWPDARIGAWLDVALLLAIALMLVVGVPATARPR